jgi:hypothetical protein
MYMPLLLLLLLYLSLVMNVPGVDTGYLLSVELRLRRIRRAEGEEDPLERILALRPQVFHGQPSRRGLPF